MRCFFLTLVFVGAFVGTKGQINLVKNPSFEQYSKCPTTVNMIKSATYWQAIDSIYPDTSIPAAVCTPEYCNTCDTTLLYSEVSVPQGLWYYHYPRTGNGMVMIETYYDNSYLPLAYQRDYLQGHLYKSLIAGKRYCVTFYFTLCQFSQYANNHLGVYLDNGAIDNGQDSAGCASPQTAFNPQIVEDSIINDTLNWVKVQGAFTANGTESFITIGNFFDIHHTDTVTRNHDYLPWNTSNQCAWYLVDDVSVIAVDDSANAGPDKMMPYFSTDSVQIGDTTGYLPCYWYMDGVLIDSNKAGFKVHPDSTSSYVMQLDVCGRITYDTARVILFHEGINDPVGKLQRVIVFPNPNKGLLTVNGAGGCSLIVRDLVGSKVKQVFLQSSSQILDIGNVTPGIYFMEIASLETGEKIVRKVVKE